MEKLNALKFQHISDLLIQIKAHLMTNYQMTESIIEIQQHIEHVKPRVQLTVSQSVSQFQRWTDSHHHSVGEDTERLNS